MSASRMLTSAKPRGARPNAAGYRLGMGFVPVTGTAVLRPGTRHARVSWSSPTNAAPWLCRSGPRCRSSPRRTLATTCTRASRLLTGRPCSGCGWSPPAEWSRPGTHWRVGALSADDEDRVQLRWSDGRAGREADVARDARRDRRRDAARGAGAGDRRRGPTSGHGRSTTGWPERLAAAPRRPGPPQLVRISLRVEADEEELIAGAVRLVLQVHDEQDPLHVCDAALLWTGAEQMPVTGSVTAPGPTPRSRSGPRPKPGRCSTGWPSCGSRPDHPGHRRAGQPARGRRRRPRRTGVDVLWPRSLGRDLTANAGARPRDRAQRRRARDRLFGPDQMFSFHGRWRCTATRSPSRRWTQLARSATPVLRLRGSWAVIDPAIARKARRRLIRASPPGRRSRRPSTG